VNGHDCPFYFHEGQQETIALPVCIVSPSGFSKSFLMAQFFHRDTGICPFHSRFEGMITEAGFIARERAGGEVDMGDAYVYRDGFLLFNEISNILITGRQKHSGNLVNQVLEALSERTVHKRTGGVDIGYDTNLTIWGGIQPARFDFASGLGRRFIYVTRAWTQSDIDLLVESRLKERLSGEQSVMVNMKEVKYLREELERLWKFISVEDVVWQPEMIRYIRSKIIGHLDLQNFERVLIGKEIINQGMNRKITIDYTEQNRKLIDNVAEMFRTVSEGSDIALMIGVVGDKEVSLPALWKMFRRFSYSYSKFMGLLKLCSDLKLIERKWSQEVGGYLYYKKRMRVVLQNASTQKKAKAKLDKLIKE
jgi:hypothetical protein